MSDEPREALLPLRARAAVLITSFVGLLFDGVELGLMPIASLSVTQGLLGDAFTKKLGGEWFSYYTASLMLGAALGGIFLGELGDRVGRARAMGISILFYSIFAGLGAYVQTQEQMLVLRFFVGLGAGGMWPNGVALVAESCSPGARPWVSGFLGAGINVGILLLAIIAGFRPITPDSWRWIFKLGAIPALLGVGVLLFLPESPKWLASRREVRKRPLPVSVLLRGPILRLTIIGALLGSIAQVGAWSASKWMVPWADAAAGAAEPGYKASVQAWWAFGATFGSFLGARIAVKLGRRLSYFLISLSAMVVSIAMFQATAPLRSEFKAVVLLQGLVSTLYFGWLPLYLPELFPTRVRAAGAGFSFNFGRFATAAGVLLAGALFSTFGESYSAVGATFSLVYGLGMIVICFAPDTQGKIADEA